MDRQPLQSAALASAGYDPETRALEVEFRSGRIYRYDDVPSSVFEWLLRTPSKGAFLSRMIDGHYAYVEVTPRPDAGSDDSIADALRASLERLDS